MLYINLFFQVLIKKANKKSMYIFFTKKGNNCKNMQKVLILSFIYILFLSAEDI